MCSRLWPKAGRGGLRPTAAGAGAEGGLTVPIILMTDVPPSVFRDRRLRVSQKLEQFDLRYVLISKPVDVYYLSGFRGSAGALLLGNGRPLLWVDPRYTLQAREESRGAAVMETREPLSRAVAQWLVKKRTRAVGFQDGHLTCAELARLRAEVRKAVGRSGSALRWQPVDFLVDQLRAVKDRWEIDRIRRAGKLTAGVFSEVLPMVRPGVRESEVAAEIEYRMKRGGADRSAFETIVASGPRAAWPHARASSRRLRRGELVILDLGAILAGYAADMTRTLYLGRPTRRARELYDSVAEAQRETVHHLHAGMTAEAVDAVARETLARRKLDEFFTHSTGHGVGLEVHERPRLGRGEQTLVPAGAVVTIEPGLYLEGYGGVRIEDTVLVGDNTAEILTPAPKDPWFTG